MSRVNNMPVMDVGLLGLGLDAQKRFHVDVALALARYQVDVVEDDLLRVEDDHAQLQLLGLAQRHVHWKWRQELVIAANRLVTRRLLIVVVLH